MLIPTAQAPAMPLESKARFLNAYNVVAKGIANVATLDIGQLTSLTQGQRCHQRSKDPETGIEQE